MFFTGYCQLLKHWSSRSQSIKYHSLRKHTYSTVSVDAKYRTCSVQQSLANYSTSKDATEAEDNANETEEPEVEVTGISNPFMIIIIPQLIKLGEGRGNCGVIRRSVC